MASVPAVTAFELSRYAYPQADPSQLKQGDFPHKHAPLMPCRAACGSDQYIQAAQYLFLRTTVIHNEKHLRFFLIFASSFQCRGALNERAEIILSEPAPGNAGEGNATVQQVFTDGNASN
jgi:hypothetical protein